MDDCFMELFGQIFLFSISGLFRSISALLSHLFRYIARYAPQKMKQNPRKYPQNILRNKFQTASKEIVPSFYILVLHTCIMVFESPGRAVSSGFFGFIELHICCVAFDTPAQMPCICITLQKPQGKKKGTTDALRSCWTLLAPQKNSPKQPCSGP